MDRATKRDALAFLPDVSNGFSTVENSFYFPIFFCVLLFSSLKQFIFSLILPTDLMKTFFSLTFFLVFLQQK